MKKVARSPLVAMLGAVWLTACSKDDDKDPPAAVTVYGTLTVEGSTSNDNGTFSLTKQAACTKDATSGLLTVDLSDQNGVAGLKMLVRSFISTPKAYPCKQAVGNTTAGTLGERYDDCMVLARSSTSEGKQNAYAMYRDEAEKSQSFTYRGECQINVTEATPTAKGTVSCTKMLQTVLNGTTRNPIQDTAAADVKADFTCTVK